MNTNNHDVLTLAEAAAYLRVHRRTMTRLLRQGVVPGTKIGRQWRIRRADLDRVLAGGPLPEPNANGATHGELSPDETRVTRAPHASWAWVANPLTSAALASLVRLGLVITG